MGNCHINAIAIVDGSTVDSEQSHTSPEKSRVSPEEIARGKGEGLAASTPVVFSPQIEIEREISQKKLRELVTNDPIDWRKVICLAEELHKKEQACLKSDRARRRRITNKRWHSPFFESRQRRRRRMDSVGSFSVNIISIEQEECRYQGDAAERQVSNPTVFDSADELDELEIYEDDGHKHSQPLPARQRPSTPSPFDLRNRPQQQVVIGGFMAATSLFNLPEEEESGSSSSDDDDSVVSLSGITRKLTFDDSTLCGLLTIAEEEATYL